MESKLVQSIAINLINRLQWVWYGIDQDLMNEIFVSWSQGSLTYLQRGKNSHATCKPAVLVTDSLEVCGRGNAVPGIPSCLCQRQTDLYPSGMLTCHLDLKCWALVIKLTNAEWASPKQLQMCNKLSDRGPVSVVLTPYNWAVAKDS